MDLPSSFLLMATRDRTGRPMGYHQYGFGAAVLGEMVLSGHLVLDGKRVRATGGPPEDVRYATVWHDIRARRRPARAYHWVAKLSGGRYRLLRRQFTQRLVDQGALRARPTWWGGFRYPSQDTGTEAALRQRIRAAVQTADAADDRLVCLIAILVAAGSTRELDADRRVRRAIRKQAKRWIKDQPLARSVQDLIGGMTAAVIAASVAASTAS